jgi:ribosomal protein S18 acetylase RimI-like enzyme
MKSLIRDNGLVNPLNRGNFYGCRDLNGHLEGVALVGHATLMETVSDRALQALARVARECPYTHMIMGEQERVTDFWKNYSDAGHAPRLACRERLLELQKPDATSEPVSGLRLATEKELDWVMPIQAQLAFEESGVDPLTIDPEGFRQRCLRRIRQGRTWVLFEAGSLIFKADVISETNEVFYLEGIWVNGGRRNDGIGTRCMAELSRRLLSKAKSICLLANELNTSALTFYRKCGFLFRATYETVFLAQRERLPN